MWLILFIFIYYVDAIYFSISNITVTIPLDKEKFPSKYAPIATFYAVGKTSLNYSIEGSSFLMINQSGEVSFSRTFFEADTQKVDGISSKIAVQDSSDKQTATSFYVDFQPLQSFDCDFIVEELCFWETVEYRVEENSKPTLIGTLASPFLSEICANCYINYTMLNKNEEFSIVRFNRSYFIQSTQPLDREKKSQYFLKILCTVENAEQSIRNVTKNLLVTVLDVDDNPPKAQEENIQINISSKHVQKDQYAEHNSLIFYDRDTLAVNRYKPTILNDSLKILKAVCNKLPNDHLKEEVETAVHCKLKFTKTIPVEKWTYSVVLQLNNTSLINGNKTVTLPIDLHFLNESGYHPKLYKKRIKPSHLYPRNNVRIFRTAAPLARVTQPSIINGVKNFTIKSLTPGHQDVFRVTNSTGIVYVHDSQRLRNAPESLRLNISWINATNRIDYDEIEVDITNESTPTCTDITNIKDWISCSEINNPDECLSPETCALSTGGSSNIGRESANRCTWRGERNPTNGITTLYSTCTPDAFTCPNKECDELEELHDDICPQDCTRDVLVPSEKNKDTHRGIYRGSGVCFCHRNGTCQCNPIEKPKSTKNPNKRKQNKKFPTNSTNTTLRNPDPTKANVSSQIFNVTSKILGIEIARCGTTCIFGIIAGVLFLLAAVTIIVICWKLDSVHRAVRNKFSGENPDLATPLSDYIDRSVPDPIPLNFDMTTSLADTAILNIINKYEPDPKWEFPRNQLIIEQTLGEGEFGKVLRAKALNIAAQSGYSTVAVKTLKDDARESELNDLLSEYQLLKEVSHPNVIRLLGVCTAPGGPIYLIIEFAEYGSLRNYLRRSRHLKSECGRLPTSAVDESEIHYDEPNISKVTPREIISFAWQICKGMAYLSEIKLVHRDLAARNVLLAVDKICKISDFGLTRDIYEDDAYFKKSKGRVPVKWMAPESLSDHVYTNKSDVWSFGILIWELVTLGATPYPGIAVQNLFHLLRQGYRMERPDNCSPALYNIMRNCWNMDPEQRPTFQELSVVWEKMLSDDVEYLDLANNAIHNRSYFCSPFENSLELSNKSETNSVNYLSKSQPYVKCGSGDKFQDKSNFLTGPDNNQNDINTQGYETPVKVPNKVQTPTNDCPQYYTDMAAGRKD